MLTPVDGQLRPLPVRDCVALIPAVRRHRPRYLTDRYLTWANAVVRACWRSTPTSGSASSPTGDSEPPGGSRPTAPDPLHHLRPHEADRPAGRADGQSVTQRWAAVLPTVGWYDYIYGSAYLVPRVYFHQMADYYRFANQNGVRCLVAEAYPNFAEGPKLWVSLKLQWDPTQDVDALLDEWYEAAVGPEAAPFVKQYYAHWEDFWTRRILDSDWWTPAGQYLRFNVPTYLEDVKREEIAQSRAAGARWRRRPATVRTRAELLLRGFGAMRLRLSPTRAGRGPPLGDRGRRWRCSTGL